MTQTVKNTILFGIIALMIIYTGFAQSWNSALLIIAMGLISLPIMLRYGYDRRLASGVIVASGTLAQIIPPSLVLIVLADQLGRSVGRRARLRSRGRRSRRANATPAAAAPAAAAAAVTAAAAVLPPAAATVVVLPAVLALLGTALSSMVPWTQPLYSTAPAMTVSTSSAVGSPSAPKPNWRSYARTWGVSTP